MITSAVAYRFLGLLCLRLDAAVPLPDHSVLDMGILCTDDDRDWMLIRISQPDLCSITASMRVIRFLDPYKHEYLRIHPGAKATVRR